MAAPDPASSCPVCGRPRAIEVIQVPGLGPRPFPVDCPCEVAEREAAARQERLARREARISRLLAQSGVGPRHRDATFETFEVTRHSAPILEICRAFVARFPDGGRGLTLAGPPGTGRTHLGVALTRALVEREVAALIFNVPELLRTAREHLGTARGRFDALLDLLCRSDHLLLGRPRAGAAHGVDAGDALPRRQRALRGVPRDERRDEPRARRPRGARRLGDRGPPRGDEHGLLVRMGVLPPPVTPWQLRPAPSRRRMARSGHSASTWCRILSRARFDRTFAIASRPGDLLRYTQVPSHGPMTFPRIMTRPDVCTGKPCVRDLRVPGSRLLELLAAGQTREEILRACPYLEAADIEEALR